MTKADYDSELKNMLAEFDRKVELLQQKYAREYSGFRVGDLVRSRTGFKMTCKILEVNHFAEGKVVHTVLTVIGTTKDGKEHSKSRIMKVQDNDMINLCR